MTERTEAQLAVPDDELARYIAKCREMSTSGLSAQEIADGKIYSWWSRLAEILSVLEATHPAQKRGATTDKSQRHCRV